MYMCMYMCERADTHKMKSVSDQKLKIGCLGVFVYQSNY